MSNDQDTGFPAKWLKKLPPGFQETAERMDNDEVKKRLIDCQKAIVQYEKDMENDVKLADFKERVKELSAIYKEPINDLKYSIKYLLYVMEGRGL